MKVEVVPREITFFKHGDPTDKKKITGRGKKVLLDVTAWTRMPNMNVVPLSWMCHVHRGEFRAVFPNPTTCSRKTDYMREDEFRKFCEKKWGIKGKKVLKLVGL